MCIAAPRAAAKAQSSSSKKKTVFCRKQASQTWALVIDIVGESADENAIQWYSMQLKPSSGFFLCLWLGLSFQNFGIYNWLITGFFGAIIVGKYDLNLLGKLIPFKLNLRSSNPTILEMNIPFPIDVSTLPLGVFLVSFAILWKWHHPTASDFVLQSQKTCWKHWWFKLACFYRKKTGARLSHQKGGAYKFRSKKATGKFPI